MDFIMNSNRHFITTVGRALTSKVLPEPVRSTIASKQECLCYVNIFSSLLLQLVGTWISIQLYADDTDPIPHSLDTLLPFAHNNELCVNIGKPS